MLSVTRYKNLLEKSFLWTQKARKQYGSWIQCSPGCGECCRGLFYVSKLDILMISNAFMSLGHGNQKQIENRARTIKSEMKDKFNITRFNQIDDHIEQLFYKRFEHVYCPFLSKKGECLIYDHRPFICRLQGLPVHDGSQWSFESCCEKNSLLREIIHREHDCALFHFDYKTFSQNEKALFIHYDIWDDYGKYYVIPDFIELL